MSERRAPKPSPVSGEGAERRSREAGEGPPHTRISRARALRANMTDAERKLWLALRDGGGGAGRGPRPSPPPRGGAGGGGGRRGGGGGPAAYSYLSSSRAPRQHDRRGEEALARAAGSAPRGSEIPAAGAGRSLHR